MSAAQIENNAATCSLCTKLTKSVFREYLHILAPSGIRILDPNKSEVCRAVWPERWNTVWHLIPGILVFVILVCGFFWIVFTLTAWFHCNIFEIWIWMISLHILHIHGSDPNQTPNLERSQHLFLGWKIRF